MRDKKPPEQIVITREATPEDKVRKGQHFVSVGTYSNPREAQRVADTLVAQHHKVYIRLEAEAA